MEKISYTLMSRLWECKKAVSPVVATVLLVGITVIIVSILVLSAFAFGAFEHEIAPMAVIVALEAEGGECYFQKSQEAGTLA